MYRAIATFREDLKQKMYRRYALTDSVQKNHIYCESYRAKKIADCAFAQLQIERKVRLLVDVMATALEKISQLNSEVASLRKLTERLGLELKNRVEILNA